MFRLFIQSLSRPCTFSRIVTCTLSIECEVELNCVATDLSLFSLMSRRCSSILSFSCRPVSPTYTSFSACDAVYHIPLITHRVFPDLFGTNFAACFTSRSLTWHVPLQLAMHKDICEITISSVGCYWFLLKHLLHPFRLP